MFGYEQSPNDHARIWRFPCSDLEHYDAFCPFGRAIVKFSLIDEWRFQSGVSKNLVPLSVLQGQGFMQRLAHPAERHSAITTLSFVALLQQQPGRAWRRLRGHDSELPLRPVREVFSRQSRQLVTVVAV